MKTKKFFFVPVVILVCAFLLGCGDFSNEQEQEQRPDKNGLTRDDELALFWAEQDFIKSQDELVQDVQNFLSSKKDTKYTQLVITDTQPFSKKYEPGFITEAGPQKSSDVQFYLFILKSPEKSEEPGGYAWACNDMRIGNILTVAEKGDYNDKENQFLNVFKANIDDYIRATIAGYNAVTKEAVVAAQEKALLIQKNLSRAVFGDNGDGLIPAEEMTQSELAWEKNLITTTWGQCGDPYNGAVKGAMNIPNYGGVIPWPKGERITVYRVGYDVTALAQLVAFWERADRGKTHKPDSPMKSQCGRGNVLNDVYGYTDVYGEYRDFSAMNYEWAQMKFMPNALDLVYDFPDNRPADHRAEVATLFLQVGCRMGKVFTEKGGELTPIEYVCSALDSMGYSGYSIQDCNNDSPLESSICQSIKEGKPVYGCVSGADGVYAAWLIDNYEIKTTSSGHTSVYLHCNLGNDFGQGEGNDWYFGAPLLYMSYVPYYNNTLKQITGAYNLGYITGIEWRE